jgi:hypothetical protein
VRYYNPIFFYFGVLLPAGTIIAEILLFVELFHMSSTFDTVCLAGFMVGIALCMILIVLGTLSILPLYMERKGSKIRFHKAIGGYDLLHDLKDARAVYIDSVVDGQRSHLIIQHEGRFCTRIEQMSSNMKNGIYAMRDEIETPILRNKLVKEMRENGGLLKAPPSDVELEEGLNDEDRELALKAPEEDGLNNRKLLRELGSLERDYRNRGK